MNSKTIKIIVVTLSLILAFPLFGCNLNSDVTYEPYGEFISLTFAYEQGYITDKDASIIYNKYQNKNNKVNTTLKSIQRLTTKRL